MLQRGLDILNTARTLNGETVKARQMDFWGVQNIVEGLEKADWYLDNGETFENITDADVGERLDEILDYAKSFKS